MNYTMKGFAIVGGGILAGLYVWAFWVRPAMQRPGLLAILPTAGP